MGIVRGKITTNGEGYSVVVFGPDKIRFLALTLQHGTKLETQSYACQNCGTVWSQTDPIALRKFIRKHCKQPNNEESTS